MSTTKYLCATEKYEGIVNRKNNISNCIEKIGGDVVVFDEKRNLDIYKKRLEKYTDNNINIHTKKLDMNYQVILDYKMIKQIDEYGSVYMKGFDDSGKYAIIKIRSKYHWIPFDRISQIGINTKSFIPKNYTNK